MPRVACLPAVSAALLLNLLAGCERVPAPASTPQRVAATAVSSAPGGARGERVAVAAVPEPPPVAAASAGELPQHGAHGAAASPCLAQSVPAQAPRAVTVHRWVDAAGITHYADRAPAAGARDHRVLEVAGAPPVAVDARGYDVNLPDQLQQRAVADTLGVQRILRDALGVEPPGAMTLHIVFVRSADAYARLVGEPSLASSAGAYSTGTRTIHVRMQASDEATFAVLRHEIIHALVHESIGNLPTPLNEGLAGYFARYRTAGTGGQVVVGGGPAALKRAAASGDPGDALVDLLAREGAAFYAADTALSSRDSRYLRAYALVALLMGDAQGRSALAGVLAAQRAEPCRPVAAEQVLDAAFPGGLAALARAWNGFMLAPPDTVRTY
jgi:hypothetical protein